MGIRLKLVLVLLFISFVPIVFLSISGVQIASQSLRDEISSKFANMAIEKSRAIEVILNDKIEESVILSTHPLILEALRKANKRYETLSDAEAMDNILMKDKKWIAQKGQTKTASAISQNALSGLFKQYHDRDPTKYGELFVTDQRGANVAMTKTLSDYYQGDESWWKESYAGGKGAVLFDDRGYDTSVGAFVIGAVVPVRDAGKIIGILKINFKFKGLLSVINVDSDKNIISSIARNSGSFVIVFKDRRPNEVTPIENGILMEKKGGWAMDNHDGVKTIMGYAPISVPIYSRILPSGAKPGVMGEAWHKTTWFVFLDLDHDIAFASMQKISNTFWGVGLGGFLVVLVVAAGLATNISRPIQELHDATRAIAAGNFDHSVPVERKDEIGGLARSFMSMTEKLRVTMTAQQKLAQTIEQSPTMMMITDLKGTIEYVNERFYEITGYAPDEVIGKTPRILKSGKTPEAVYKDLWKTIQRGDVWQHELEDRTKNGEAFWANVTIAPIRSADGVVINFAASHEDITSRKEAENKMRVATNQAMVANRAKTDLIANMSHELRTPLNAIIGFSSSIQAEIFGPVGNKKYVEYMDDINFSGQHLLDLINDILDVSAIEANALVLHEEEVKIKKVTAASIRMIKARADDAKVTVESLINSDCPNVFVDERRIKQVLLNLLSNAVKFTPEHGEVKISAQLNGDGALKICVTDTGIGMNNEDVKVSLSKFGQVDSGLNRKYEGSGLGLPLAVGLMQQHGGGLDIQSKEGEGTQVTVTFPKDRVRSL
ncbi:MAG: PAS domain S-box protein [Magnetovibrio sp.]|nr:PAS domain S-box protein [Magnetovibrio sp.]